MLPAIIKPILRIMCMTRQFPLPIQSPPTKSIAHSNEPRRVTGSRPDWRGGQIIHAVREQWRYGHPRLHSSPSTTQCWHNEDQPAAEDGAFSAYSLQVWILQLRGMSFYLVRYDIVGYDITCRICSSNTWLSHHSASHWMYILGFSCVRSTVWVETNF